MTDGTPQDAQSRTLLQRLFGISHRNVTESHKELRFTRSRQATQFFILAAFFLVLGTGSFTALFASWGPNDPDFYKYVWLCFLPVIPAYFTLRFALRCVYHAYILLTPMGIEIFPFFKPEKNLQCIFWDEIVESECSSSLLTLHTNAEKTAGVMVTLKPIAKAQICLLQKAISTRTANK